MKIVEIPVEQLKEDPNNANVMDQQMTDRLRESIRRYGLVQNLVVRQIGKNAYEVLSGNQRLKVIKEMGFTLVSCVVVTIDDAQARLLAQALNRVRGEDDLGLRADVVKEILKKIPQSEVLNILPETALSLKSFSALRQEDMTTYLKNWQVSQSAKLKHLQFQLSPAQLEVVEKVLVRFISDVKRNQVVVPNIRGTALYLLCKSYLEKGE
jgi:ParB family transcriptional regulator, chromosome partitioning protein